MKLVFRSRIGPIVVLASYVVLPGIGFALWRAPAALVGLCLAYGLDGRYPRWYAGLRWQEVEEAVQRLYEFPSRRSGLRLLIGHRQATLFRYTPKEAAKLAFFFPLAAWRDLLTSEAEDAFGKHGAGVWYEDVVRGKIVFFAQASSQRDAVHDCVQMLRHAVNLAGADLAADVLIRPWGVTIGGKPAEEDTGSGAS